jgi:hypothetical protein
MPATNLEQVATYLPKEVKNLLQEQANELGVSLAAMIRIVLKDWAENRHEYRRTGRS